ncbi:hypothetical protein M9H77_11337 [Catharanthus roseus]|uniref:Uncharacterized protein n=1 Tax=Catharanthus roseus TaxID=4058 RepID=A0ACC0BEH2_CATRO|nr:hypothetical protein M9H77_11337 [Catharanthus roseus]
MKQEIDDTTTGVLEGPTSSPTQYASVMGKVQIIIHRCIVSIGGTLSCTHSQHNIQQAFVVQPSHCRPWEPIPKHGAHGVKRGIHRLPGSGRMKDTLLPLHIWADEDKQIPDMEGGERGGGSGGRGHGDLGSYPPLSKRGTSYAPLPPSEVGLSFDAPPPPGTAGSFVSHMPISRASSFDSDEYSDDPSDDVTPAQQLRFGHRVRNMGSGEQIDDLSESGTIRLLNWNDVIADLQLEMRFVDKIQAISTIQKWSIPIGREFRVAKSSSKQELKYDFKIYFKTNISFYYQRSRDLCLERHPRSASITLDGLYVQEGMAASLTLNLSQSRLSALSVSHSSSISTSSSAILIRQQPQPTTLTSRRLLHPPAASLQTFQEQSTRLAAPLRTTGPLLGSAAAQTPHAVPTHRTSAWTLSGNNKSDSGK